MSGGKTHRLAAKPRISARLLSDYMAASDRARRTIMTDSKFVRLARGIQHRQAKALIGHHLRSGSTDTGILFEKGQDLRDRLTDDDFERETLDHNADYVQRFAAVAGNLRLPQGDTSAPHSSPSISLNGMTVTVDLCLRLSRTTKTNKLRVGAATLRYAKGKALSPNVGAWQSAFLFGYVAGESIVNNAETEHKLCLTIDAITGLAYPAPTDALNRFKNMAAACATIADAWPNLSPPRGAVL